MKQSWLIGFGVAALVATLLFVWKRPRIQGSDELAAMPVQGLAASVYNYRLSPAGQPAALPAPQYQETP